MHQATSYFRRTFFPLAVLSQGVLASIAHADTATPIELGYWEVRVRAEMIGLMQPPTNRVEKICITAKDVEEGIIAITRYRGCPPAPGTWNGTTLQLNYACPVPYAQANGQLQSKGKTFSSYIHFVSIPPDEGPAQLRVNFSHVGSWISAECPGDEKK